MEVTEYKCDICGAKAIVEDYGLPKGWCGVVCIDFWRHSKDICESCADRSGLKPALDALKALKDKAGV